MRKIGAARGKVISNLPSDVFNYDGRGKSHESAMQFKWHGEGARTHRAKIDDARMAQGGSIDFHTTEKKTGKTAKKTNRVGTLQSYLNYKDGKQGQSKNQSKQKPKKITA